MSSSRRLAVGGHDRRFQRGIELALFADRIEDGSAAFFKFAQIGQPLFQSAQLRVVERAGRFLAVAGNERNRGAAIEQRDGRLDLLLAYTKLLRNLLINLCHANPSKPVERPNTWSRGRCLWTILE